MKFIVDESTGTAVAEFLRAAGYDVLAVTEDMPGADDRDILAKAEVEARILITNDKDFGELVFRQGKPHHGIVFLRLEDESPENRVRLVNNVMDKYASRLKDNFIVATERGIRIRAI